MKDKLIEAINNSNHDCCMNPSKLADKIYALIEQERIEIAFNLKEAWNEAIVERLEDILKVPKYIEDTFGGYHLLSTHMRKEIKKSIQELKGEE